MERSTWMPKTMEKSTWTPKTLERSTWMPKTVERSTWTPKAMERSTWTPKTMERLTRTPKVMERSTWIPKTTERSIQTPKAMQSVTGTPTTMERLTWMPKAMERSTWTPKTMGRSTRTPKAMERSTWTPKTMERSIQTPKGMESATWTPTTMERPTWMPQAMKRSTQAPKTMERSTWTPKTMERSIQTPKAMERLTWTPTNMERSTWMPKTMKRSTWTPKAMERSTWTPKTLERSTWMPKTVERSTWTPKAMEKLTWTPKTMERSTWTPKAMERLTWTPKTMGRSTWTPESRGIVMNESADPLCANLINLSGPRWRILRTKLSPGFTAGKIRQMFGLIEESSKIYKEFVRRFAINEEPVEFRDLAAKFTTEVISTCCFGLETNSIQEADSEFRGMCRRVLDPSLVISLKRLVRSYLPGVFKWFRMSLTPPEVTKYFMSVVSDMINYREKNNFVRHDMMQLLMQVKNEVKVLDVMESDVQEEVLANGMENACKKDSDIVITDHMIAAQAYIFFLAGFETSSTTMSFTMYELAVNPAIQEKLYAEIDATLRKHGAITYDAISEMEYLDRVIRETLRKYPPVGMVPRLCNKTYEIPGTDIVIEKGIKVLIPIHAIHHDPQYYPEPWKYDPGRFLDENKKLRDNCTFLPFGEGPRICIGTRFAYVQTKVGLVALLSEYEVVPSSKTVSPLVYDQTANVLTSKSGIWLKIRHRQKKD